jgi:hypothetical protein
MFHWLHHLFNPHCAECNEKSYEDKVCKSCETLKEQLAIANIEKRQMLESILSLTAKPAENQSSPPVDYEKLKPKMMTWNVRRQMLEAEDRKAAQVLAEQRKNKDVEKDIEELEKEVGIAHDIPRGESGGIKSDA